MILRDFIEKTIDNRGKNPSKYYESEKYPVIDNVLIKNKIYPNLSEVNRYIDQETFDSFLRGYVHRGMPLMTLVGNGIGNVTLAPGDDVAIIQNTVGFQVKENLDEKYLYYYLLSNNERIRNFDRGSGQPSIRKTDILGMEVDFPDIDIQKNISKFLYLIDLKIERNENINKNLEQQAFAIFNEMFVDSIYGENFVGDILTPNRGKGLLSKDAVPGNVPVVAGGLEPATYHNQSNTVAPVLTISASGANAGYVNLWNIPVWSSDSSFIDTNMTENVYFWYAMLKSRQSEIFDAQTGSAQPHIYPKHIARLPMGNIRPDEINQYTVLVSPLFEAIGANKEENLSLASMRDALLPKLMSGEIDVTNIDL